MLSENVMYCQIFSYVIRYYKRLSKMIWLEIVNFGQVMLLERGVVEVLGKIMEMVIKLADF